MKITIRLISGLGNQLFQYAAGTYFSKRYGAPLSVAVDMQGAISHGLFQRPFLLSKFSIQAPVREISPLERLIMSKKHLLAVPRRLLTRARRAQVIEEASDQRFKSVTETAVMPGIRTMYLQGYWQCFGYAEAVEPELRRELTPREPPAGKNAAVLERILSAAYPVSIHLRRGDYTLAVEGNIALPLSYYRKAIRIVQEMSASATFFVFSDDIEFARESFAGESNFVFIDHNDDFTAHEDLRLMSSCHSHIIANSSFSWWGAWLNARPDKIVIAPKYWHLSRSSYFPELLHPSWIAIDHLEGSL